MAHTIDRSIAGPFTRHSALAWLLGLNVAIFVALRMLAIAGVFAGSGSDVDDAIAALSLPAGWSAAWVHPWGWITYMVTQYDPAHLIFNMLWLAWFGMLMYRRCGNRVLLGAYISGGLLGALSFLVWSTSAPDVSGLIGASAAVMSVSVAIAVISPGMRVEIPFIGRFRLKWVAAVMLAIAVTCYSGYHPGSDAAHAGGVLAGAIFGFAYRAVNRHRATASSISGSLTPSAPASPSNLTDTQLLNTLLDKIRRSGYDSLSATERNTLDTLSRRLKNN